MILEASVAEGKASERIWRNVQQGRVEQGDIVSTDKALRQWAQAVQKTGLSAAAELQMAILSLAQPTEGVDRMYHHPESVN